MKGLRELKPEHKRVLIRADFNVPLENGVIKDNTRIVQELPTINYLLEHRAKIILMSHLGRPKGFDKALSLEPVSKELSKLLNTKITFMKDCIGDSVKNAVNSMKDRDIILLENTRFYKEDKENNEEFAKKLASLGDVFVMDAFGASHRADASTLGVQRFLQSYYGFLVEKEIKNIKHVLTADEHPFVAVLGGAKVSDKIGVINNLLKKADYILLGGGMPFPFLLRMGLNIGSSILDGESVKTIEPFFKNKKIILPKDFLVAENTRSTHAENVDFDKIPDGSIALDIGKKTIREFSEIIRNAKMVVWNGPMGLFENPVFAKGTIEIGKAVSCAEFSLVGGGDTTSALKDINVKFTHVSTGGGAMLEMLAGKKLKALPGIEIS